MAGLGAALAPDPIVLIAAVAIDLVVGDPVYAWHPVRFIGRAIAAIEGWLRRRGADGYGGGIALFGLLSCASLVVLTAAMALATTLAPWAPRVLGTFIAYSLLALGDLVHHVRRIERAIVDGDLPRARHAVSALVGRDTDHMDAGACRRAGVESLSENLTDGFVSPVVWYAIAGLPGLVLFKVVSTMDSMVGYKTPRYLQFGWCGARLDDVMNYVPARLTWLVITAIAAIWSGASARGAWRVGREQHAVLLGPNSGWSEAAMAGAIRRRIVGPIYRDGTLVTDVWIGDPCDPPLETTGDVARAIAIAIASGVAVTAGVALVLAWLV